MDDPRIRLAHDSLTLLSAAERLQQGAGDRACACYLPAALECIEQSLHALSRSCHAAAHALIPPGDLHESISHRYARAAAASLRYSMHQSGTPGSAAVLSVTRPTEPIGGGDRYASHGSSETV